MFFLKTVKTFSILKTKTIARPICSRFSVFFLIVAVFLVPTLLRADGFFPYGVQSKFVGFSAVGVSDVGAVFYSPHSIRLSDRDFNLKYEAGYGYFQESYEHPQFDPVHIDVGSPLVAIALGLKPSRYALRFEYALVPTGTGASQNIRGFPRRLSGEIYEPLNLKMSNAGWDQGIALSWPFWNRVQIGTSLIASYSDHRLEADLISNRSAVYRGYSQNMIFYPVFSMGWQGSLVVFDASYSPHRRRNYEGTQTVAGEAGPSTRKSFKPEVWRAKLAYEGLAVAAASLAVGVQFKNEVWRNAIGYLGDSLASAASPIAIRRSILDYHFYTKVTFSTEDKISVGWTKTSTPYLDGHFKADGEGSTIGADFGDFRNMDKRGFSVNWQTRWGPEITYGFLSGNREVNPETGYYPGYYQSRRHSLSVGHSLSF